MCKAAKFGYVNDKGINLKTIFNKEGYILMKKVLIQWVRVM